MSARVKLWWIKQRYNPQLGTYYSKMGQLSKTAAKRHEKPLYGMNWMHGFATEAEYLAEIKRLEQAGESLQ